MSERERGVRERTKREIETHLDSGGGRAANGGGGGRVCQSRKDSENWESGALWSEGEIEGGGMRKLHLLITY